MEVVPNNSLNIKTIIPELLNDIVHALLKAIDISFGSTDLAV